MQPSLESNPRPLRRGLPRVDAMYRELEEGLDAEIAARLEDARVNGAVPTERGATWTYLITDAPFETGLEALFKNFGRMILQRK